MPMNDETREKLRMAREWEHRVANMKTFEIPAHYDSVGAQSKCDRFHGYLKDWIYGMFEAMETGYGDDWTNHSEADRNFVYLEKPMGYNVTGKKVDKDGKPLSDAEKKELMWQAAMARGSGKQIAEDVLPWFREPNQDTKDAVNNVFLPVYTAIKERFDKRWFFEWIFNHDQYVAERDALKAIEGIVKNLSGNAEAFEADAAAYRTVIDQAREEERREAAMDDDEPDLSPDDLYDPNGDDDEEEELENVNNKEKAKPQYILDMMAELNAEINGEAKQGSESLNDKEQEKERINVIEDSNNEEKEWPEDNKDEKDLDLLKEQSPLQK